MDKNIDKKSTVTPEKVIITRSESNLLDQCFNELTNELVSKIDQGRLEDCLDKSSWREWIETSKDEPQREVKNKVLAYFKLDKVSSLDQLQQNQVYQLAYSIAQKRQLDFSKKEENEREEQGESVDDKSDLSIKTETKEEEKQQKIDDLRIKLAVDSQVDVIDEEIEDDWRCLTDYLARKDGTKYDIVGKDSIEIDHMVKEVQKEDPEKLNQAMAACFRVARYFYLKHRRKTDQIPWEKKYILRKISQEIFTDKEYREFWKKPESMIIKLGDWQDRQRTKYEKMLELAGMDSDHVFDLRKISHRELLAILGIRENFIHDFHGRVLSDLQEQRPNDQRERPFKLKSVAYLVTAAAARMFEWRSIKFVNRTKHDKDKGQEYFGSRGNRWTKWMPSKWLRNKFHTKKMNQLCEEWVDKIVVARKEKLSDAEILSKIFGQRMNSKNEMTKYQRDIFDEALVRADKQEVFNREYKPKRLNRKKYSVVKSMDVEERYQLWLQDEIDFDNFQQQLVFEWGLLEEKYDAPIETMMRQIRVKGKHHALFLNGELQGNAGVDYRNICQKTWKSFIFSLF